MAMNTNIIKKKSTKYLRDTSGAIQRLGHLDMWPPNPPVKNIQLFNSLVKFFKCLMSVSSLVSIHICFYHIFIIIMDNQKLCVVNGLIINIKIRLLLESG